MDKTDTYALILSLIMLAMCAMPGIILIACGVPVTLISSGLGISVILFSKGYIANRVFGFADYRVSCPILAALILTITILKGMAKAYTEYTEYQMMPMFGSEIMPIDKWASITNIIVPSLVWAVMTFIIVVIVAFYRQRHPVRTVPLGKLKERDTVVTAKDEYIYHYKNYYDVHVMEDREGATFSVSEDKLKDSVVSIRRGSRVVWVR